MDQKAADERDRGQAHGLHPVTDDIANLQMRDLTGLQPTTVGNAEGCACNPRQGAASRIRASCSALSPTEVFLAAR